MKGVLRKTGRFKGTAEMVMDPVTQGRSRQHPELKRSWDSERAQWEPRLPRIDPGSHDPLLPPAHLLCAATEGPQTEAKFSLSAKAVATAERAGGRMLRCRPRKSNIEIPELCCG